MNSVKADSNQDLGLGGRRSFKVYKPCNVSVAIPAVHDDYYNPTMADLKDAQSILAARTQALVNAPLQTRAMQESVAHVKKARWPSTTLRIRFPDRTQLEAVFPSSDKIKPVYAFVRGCLKEEVKPIKFILYQSLPRRDLKVSDPKVRDLSLAELDLAPSSILLLRFESEELNSSSCPPPLAEAILAEAIDIPLPPAHDASASEYPESTVPRSDQSRGRSVPKWLKLGAKKLA